jgi:hypothetical protein
MGLPRRSPAHADAHYRVILRVGQCRTSRSSTPQPPDRPRSGSATIPRRNRGFDRDGDVPGLLESATNDTKRQRKAQRRSGGTTRLRWVARRLTLYPRSIPRGSRPPLAFTTAVAHVLLPVSRWHCHRGHRADRRSGTPRCGGAQRRGGRRDPEMQELDHLAGQLGAAVESRILDETAGPGEISRWFRPYYLGRG